MKAIYRAPVVDQIKDLKRACEIALDIMDSMESHYLTVNDLKREGLQDGELALCDWVVRPRFTKSTHDCRKDAHTIPVSFVDWWNSMRSDPDDPKYRYFGFPLQIGKSFGMSREFAVEVWRSMGLDCPDDRHAAS